MANPLKLLQVNGNLVSLPIKAALLGKTEDAFKLDADVQKLQAGVAVAVDVDGAVKPATAVADMAVGFLVLDTAGYSFENTPALASGLVTVAVGGGIFETDNVADTTITAGAKLYFDTAGKITKADTNKQVVGVALNANSASDKTVRFISII